MCIRDSALDDVDLALRRIAFLTIGELAWKAAAVERAFAPDEVARLPRCFACARRIDSLADDALGNRRVLLEELSELVVDDRLNDALDLSVTKLRLGLSLELRLRDLDADDAGQSLANVVAADTRVLQIFRQVALRRIRVDRTRE